MPVIRIGITESLSAYTKEIKIEIDSKTLSIHQSSSGKFPFRIFCDPKSKITFKHMARNCIIVGIEEELGGHK